MKQLDLKTITERMVEQMGAFLVRGEEAIPMLFVVSVENDIIPQSIDLPDSHAKDQLAAYMRNLLNLPMVAAVIFLCDSYVATVPMIDEDLIGKVEVRDLPGSEEAIVASVAAKNAPTRLATRRYHRNAQGVPEFSTIEWAPVDGELSGRFAPESTGNKPS